MALNSKCPKDMQSYKDSLKATSLFGGVQVFSILISIVRSKFIAILLGPNGMGLFGLFQSTIQMISSFSGCGLGISAVKNVAAANASGDKKRVSEVAIVLRRLVWITGLVGSFICLILAPLLSQFTFKTDEYANAFRILAITVLVTQLTAGQNALLQGLRQYKRLALANVLGNLFTLLLTVPLYYFWKEAAIIPSLLIISVVTCILAWYFSRKLNLEKNNLSRQNIRGIGTNMIKMGFFVSLQGMLSVLAGYLVRIYIGRTGGMDDVGFYSAAFAIVNSYVGLVFTAMGTDYYPRLSEVASDNKRMTVLINQQAEISLLLLAPIVTLFIAFSELGVIILYSRNFLVIKWLLVWAIFGTYFKALSWCIAFSFMAKGDTKAFLGNESAAALYSFLLNILGYAIGGLTGLGISFLIGYFLYTIQVWVVCGRRYQYSLDKNLFKLLSIQIMLSGVAFMAKYFFSVLYGYMIGSIVFIIACVILYRRLNKIIDIRKTIMGKFC